MTKILRFTTLLLALAAFIGGCTVINPSEEVPYYIHVDSFTFVPVAGKGSSSHRITSATFYRNNNLLGTHELPVTIPVLGNRGDQITITPGIDYSGLGGYQVPYPFYTSDTIRLNGARGEVQLMQPKTTYYDNAKMVFSEDFDAGSAFTLAGGEVMIGRTDAPGKVFEGPGSGRILIEAGQTSSQSASVASFALSTGTPAYLEMDYKGNVVIEVGLLTVLKGGELKSEYFSFFRPRQEWRKVYIGLQDFVGTYKGTAYNLILKATRPDSVSSAEVLIDNLKVFTF